MTAAAENVPLARIAATRRWTLAFLVACGSLFVICAIAGSILNESNPGEGQSWLEEIGLIVGFGGFLASGGLIVSKRPDNVIGWMLCCCATAAALTFAAGEYAVYATYTSPGSLPAVDAVAWFQSWSWYTAIGLGLIFLPMYFPDGKLPSPRWRPLAFAAALILLIGTLPYMFAPDLDIQLPAGSPPRDNPIGVDIGPVWDAIVGATFVGLLAMLFLALFSLVVRYWRAAGDEKQQVKWLMYSVGLLILSALAEPLLPDVSGYLFVLALICVAGAIGIAVLKYRLYEIDLIINRTLVYVPLTAIVAGVYVASTGLFRAVFTELTDTGSDAAIAISTLAVVAVLTPLKNQLQALVDRHFKEQRDALAGARKLATQARSLVQVLDARQFAATYLAELATGLNAAAVRLDVDGAPEPWSLAIGEPNEAPPIKAPLLHKGSEVGTLAFWLAPSGRRDEKAEREAISEAAGLLAQVILLVPRPGTVRAASPAGVAP